MTQQILATAAEAEERGQLSWKARAVVVQSLFDFGGDAVADGIEAFDRLVVKQVTATDTTESDLNLLGRLFSTMICTSVGAQKRTVWLEKALEVGLLLSKRALSEAVSLADAVLGKRGDCLSAGVNLGE